jgi:hypothetical protein
MPDPWLLDELELDDPDLVDDPEPADEPVLDEPALLEAELVPDEPPLAVVVLVCRAAPGKAKAITPAPARPATATVAVVTRSRACPSRLAAAADRVSGSGEFMGSLRGYVHSLGAGRGGVLGNASDDALNVPSVSRAGRPRR